MTWKGGLNVGFSDSLGCYTGAWLHRDAPSYGLSLFAPGSTQCCEKPHIHAHGLAPS